MANPLRRRLASPSTPAELKDPQNWPAAMREEWGDDELQASANKHRTQLADGYHNGVSPLRAGSLLGEGGPLLTKLEFGALIARIEVRGL